jgi:predicted SnoaL-like aldol condensation-catalyzing enzyme
MDKAKIGTVLTAMLLASVAANGQDAPVSPGGEPTCVALARGLWVDVFEKKKAELSNKYIDKTYIQHDDDMPTGIDWIPFWTQAFKNPSEGPGKLASDAQQDRVTRIVSIIGDEKFALLEAIDTGTWDYGPSKGKPFKFHYDDLFRCEGDKLKEHWYVPWAAPRSGPDATPTKPVKPYRPTPAP